jgi:hypothetical protein
MTNIQRHPALDEITNYCKLVPITWIGIFKIRLARITDELSRQHVADPAIFHQHIELDKDRLLMNRVMACDAVMSIDTKEVMPLSIRSLMGMTGRFQVRSKCPTLLSKPS